MHQVNPTMLLYTLHTVSTMHASQPASHSWSCDIPKHSLQGSAALLPAHCAVDNMQTTDQHTVQCMVRRTSDQHTMRQTRAAQHAQQLTVPGMGPAQTRHGFMQPSANTWSVQPANSGNHSACMSWQAPAQHKYVWICMHFSTGQGHPVQICSNGAHQQPQQTMALYDSAVLEEPQRGLRSINCSCQTRLPCTHSSALLQMPRYIISVHPAPATALATAHLQSDTQQTHVSVRCRQTSRAFSSKARC